jgi:periplasmic protein TonB
MNTAVAFPSMGMREMRALQIAIVASLALHAFVLFMTKGIRPPVAPPELPTLTAVLRAAPQAGEVEPVAKAQASPNLEPPKPAVEPPVKPEPPKPVAPKPETPKAAPRPEAVKPPAPATPVMTAPSSTAAPTASSVAAPPAPPASTAAPEAKPVAAPPVSVASSAPTAASPGPEVDPSARAQYLIDLSKSANKYRVYPREAREHNWTGKAELKLTIGENGHIRDLAVANSSGYDVLDKSALETIRKAVPITEIKAALRNKEFTIIVPYTFTIDHVEAKPG